MGAFCSRLGVVVTPTSLIYGRRGLDWRCGLTIQRRRTTAATTVEYEIVHHHCNRINNKQRQAKGPNPLCCKNVTHTRHLMFEDGHIYHQIVNDGKYIASHIKPVVQLSAVPFTRQQEGRGVYGRQRWQCWMNDLFCVQEVVVQQWRRQWRRVGRCRRTTTETTIEILLSLGTHAPMKKRKFLNVWFGISRKKLTFFCPWLEKRCCYTQHGQSAMTRTIESTRLGPRTTRPPTNNSCHSMIVLQRHHHNHHHWHWVLVKSSHTWGIGLVQLHQRPIYWLGCCGGN